MRLLHRELRVLFAGKLGTFTDTIMVFGTGCEPDVDWSLCEEDTGFPRVLPTFYILSAVLYGATAALYTISMVSTLRLQLKEKKKMSFNTAVQMHTGVITYSMAAFIHGVSLVSPQPGLPALPLLLLVHARNICVGYVTTVLVRHWAGLYQRMGLNQQSQGQLTERISRFVTLYHEGEVIQGVVTCSFFFGTVVYGVRNDDQWERVERLQHLVWAIFSGTTCWLMTVLGHRVYANMKSVARSQGVLDYIRRVKYVVIGGSFLWCQCTVCFSIGAAVDSPMPARTWLLFHSGIVLTGVGAGFLYYTVIGSKIADKAANAVETAGVKQVKRKFKALAKLVSTGATQFMEGVNTITSMRDGSARIHMMDSGDEPASYRRIASGWILSGSHGYTDTVRRGGSVRAAGPRPSAPEKYGEEMTDGIYDEEAGSHTGGVDDWGNAEEKSQAAAPWESSVSPRISETPSRRTSTVAEEPALEDTAALSGEEDSTNHQLEDDAAHSGEEQSIDHQLLRKPAPRKRSSWSRARNPSSHDRARSSGALSSDGGEETWKVEEMEDTLDQSSPHHSRSSRHHSSNSQSKHGFHTDRSHSEDLRNSESDRGFRTDRSLSEDLRNSESDRSFRTDRSHSEDLRNSESDRSFSHR